MLSKGVVSNRGFLVNTDKDNLVFDSKWEFYVYLNLKAVNDKGGNLDIQIQS